MEKVMKLIASHLTISILMFEAVAFSLIAWVIGAQTKHEPHAVQVVLGIGLGYMAFTLLFMWIGHRMTLLTVNSSNGRE